jgi:hypothetical protein
MYKIIKNIFLVKGEALILVVGLGFFDNVIGGTQDSK